MSDQRLLPALRLLALTTWLLYALTSRGTLSADPNTRLAVVERLVQYGAITLEPGAPNTVAYEGATYSVFFPGQSIVFLPVVAGGAAVGVLTGLDATLVAAGTRFVAATFLIPIFGALSVVGLVRVLRQLDVGATVALATGAILALATPLWVYGRSGSEEVVLAALGIWAFWCLLDARRILTASSEAARGHQLIDRIGLAGVLLAAGLTHRSTFVAVALGAIPFTFTLMATGRRSPINLARARTAFWILAVVGVLSIVPLYNSVRFGNPLDTGYARFWNPLGGIFDTPLLVGLFGHLGSPGKSVFLYVPWLLLLPFTLAAGSVRRRLGALTWSLLAIITVHLLVYSQYTAWSGEFGWGVRFHVSLLPLLLIPIALWLDGVALTPIGRNLLIGLAACSMLVQAAGVSLNWGLEHYQHPETYSGPMDLVPGDAAWTWEYSQLRLRALNIAAKLRGEELLEFGDGGPGEIVTAWDIFPARAASAFGNRHVVHGLYVLSAVLAVSGVRAWRGLAKD